jgi:hypothetical protein
MRRLLFSPEKTLPERTGLYLITLLNGEKSENRKRHFECGAFGPRRLVASFQSADMSAQLRRILISDE